MFKQAHRFGKVLSLLGDVVATPAMPGHTEARCGNIEEFSKGTRLQRVLTIHHD
jgi:hypothetical protein